MKISKNAPRILKNTLLNSILIFLAVLQAMSQFLEIYLQDIEGTELALLKNLIAPGKEIAKNWVISSIALIFLLLGYILYSLLFEKTAGRKYNWEKTIWLVSINLALCNKVYLGTSVIEKIHCLNGHPVYTILFFLLVIVVTVVIWKIINKRKLEEKLSGISAAKNDLDSEAPYSNAYSKQTYTDKDQETLLRMQHPFSYAVFSLVDHSNERRKIKRDYEKEKLRLKLDTKQKKQQKKERQSNITRSHINTILKHIPAYISLTAAFCMCLGLTHIILSDEKITFFPDAFNGLIHYIENMTQSLEGLEKHLIELLMSAGILFLFPLFILTIFLLLYYAIRVTLSLLANVSEDTTKVHKISKAIKLFVLGTIDGVLRILLFLPDFLECVEENILNTDLDRKIEEYYSNCHCELQSKKNSNDVDS